jgi:hypothetical protein
MMLGKVIVLGPAVPIINIFFVLGVFVKAGDALRGAPKAAQGKGKGKGKAKGRK